MKQQLNQIPLDNLLLPIHYFVERHGGGGGRGGGRGEETGRGVCLSVLPEEKFDKGST